MKNITEFVNLYFLNNCNMQTYAKVQFSWFLPAIFIPILVFFYLAYRYQWGNNPMDLGGYIVLQVILATCILLFFRMKVVVDESHIKISYGIGLISKKIKINTISGLKIVRNPWYCYGWGLHFIPHGMIYNISGKNTVELNFKNSKEIIRIGAAYPQELKNAIEANLFPKN